jgi:transposase-like protein
LTRDDVDIHIPERRQTMANLTVETHDGMYHIRSQGFCLQFPETEKNTRVLWLLLRAFYDPDTGKKLFTHEQIAKAFGYKARQNIQNFEQEFRHCGEDILAYLQRKCKVDTSVVEAVAEVLRQHPLAPATELCPLVQERLNRPELTPPNIRKAIGQVPCSVIRPILQRQWERGEFHPKEALLLELAFAALENSSSAPDSSVASTLHQLGVEPFDPDDAQKVQQQQAEAVPLLLDVRASLAQIPVKIRLMVVAFTLYYWNVPLSRIAKWMGVSPATVLNWTTGLAVALYPIVARWIVMKTKAVSLAVDEKWLKSDKAWHYWFVGVDEDTGLPVGMALLSTRTTWACAWFLLSLRRLGLRPRAIITDGLEGYVSSIRRVFPTARHLLCLFHHQQGVTRWLRSHAVELPKQVAATLRRAMKRVVQTGDPRTVRRRLARLATADGAQDCGLDAWISQTEQKLDRLEPAVRDNAFPRTTNSIERFFRAFQRFYKTRGGFHSVMSAQRQLMLFVVGYVFTVSPDTGKAPIEQILPQAKQMPFYQILNAPFRSGLLHVCQSKSEPPQNMATQQVALSVG